MILKMSFVVFLMTTSVSVSAGVEPIGACKNLTALVKKGNVKLEDMQKFAKENLSANFTTNPDHFRKLVDVASAMGATGNDPDEQFKKCLDRMNDLSNPAERPGAVTRFANKVVVSVGLKKSKDQTADDPGVNAHLNSGETNLLIPVTKDEVRAMWKHESIVPHCEYSSFSECFGVSTSLFTAQVQEMDTFSKNIIKAVPETFSVDDCNCFESKLKEHRKNKEDIVRNDNGKEHDKLNKIIIEATGKKFLNDFATFYEDVRFYESSKDWALMKKGKFTLDKNILCTNSDAFKKTIETKCAENGSSADQEDRTAAILNAYGLKSMGDNKDFKGNFTKLMKDFETYSEKDSELDGSGDLYSREEFDGFRFSLIKTQPEVIVVNQLTAAIVRDKTLNVRLQNLIDGGDSPLKAIEFILSSMTESDEVDHILKEIKDPKCKEIISKLSKSIGTEAFNTERKRVFDIGLTIHPGLKNLLLDKDLFRPAVAGLSKKHRGIIVSAEKDHLMEDHFSKRCQALQKNLAEAVCTKPEDLREKVDTKEMIKLLDDKKYSYAGSSDAFVLSLCAMNGHSAPADSAFAGLSVDDSRPFSASDYRDEKEHLIATSMFANSAKKSHTDPVFAARMKTISNVFDYERVSSGMMGDHNMSDVKNNIRSFFDDDMGSDNKSKNRSIISTPDSYTDSKTEISKTNTNINTNSGTETTVDQINSQFKSTTNTNSAVRNSTQSYINNLPQTFEGPKVEEVALPRAELKKALSSSNQEQVGKYLENINDDDAKELLSLRNQVNKGKDEITALKLEQETKKTQDLKDQLEALEKRFTTLSKERSDNSNQPRISGGIDGGQDFKGQSFGQLNEKTNSFENKVTGETKGKFDPGNSGSSNQGGAFRDPAMAGGNNAVNFNDSDRPEMKLVITSNLKGGKKTAEDPSLELINYLSKNEPDSKTLTKLTELKESGMIYTYDVDEDGKIVKISKLIKYDELTLEAKALVDTKILLLSKKGPVNLSDLEKQMASLKRSYSYQALKLELLSAEKSPKKSQKIGPLI